MSSIQDRKNDVKRADHYLRQGCVILYPTDTIWGLGCDATNPKAVEKVFQLKQRPSSKAMIVLVRDLEMMAGYVEKIPEAVRKRVVGEVESEDPKRPTTFILPNARNLAPQLIAEDGSIAMRIPDHILCKEILDALGKPLVSTSANLSGEPFGGSFADVNPALVMGVDYVSHFHRTVSVQAKPSRILRIQEDGKVEIIRE